MSEQNPFDVIAKGKVLEELFKLQEILLVGYIKKEKLPPYPVDLSIKEHQTLIKEMGSRAIEELSEAFEVYVKLFDSIHNNRPIVNLKDVVLAGAMEISDVTHFMIELLLYANIDAQAMFMYYEYLLKEGELLPSLYDKSNLTRTVFMFARYRNIKENYTVRDYNVKMITPLYEIKESYENVFNRVHPKYMQDLQVMLWDFTHSLKKADNQLKNRAWRNAEKQTDIDKYQSQLMEAWIVFTQLLDFIGIEAEVVLYDIYKAKNIINLERQTNG